MRRWERPWISKRKRKREFEGLEREGRRRRRMVVHGGGECLGMKLGSNQSLSAESELLPALLVGVSNEKSLKSV